MSLVVFNKVVCFFPRDAFHVADFVPELDSIVLVRMLQKFWPESGRNKLGVFGQFVNHISHSFAMLSIESLLQQDW